SLSPRTSSAITVLLIPPRLHNSTIFPYTTLFRSIPSTHLTPPPSTSPPRPADPPPAHTRRPARPTAARAPRPPAALRAPSPPTRPQIPAARARTSPCPPCSGPGRCAG